jgi:trehalose 6-phosphate synthase
MRAIQDPASTLAAYGRYDVMLANPLHDGMNLAALEGPVLNERSGVLVLSKGAGAYARFRRYALGVDPVDIDETADAILQGLEMSEHDRTRRNRGLVRTIAGHTPSTWLAHGPEASVRSSIWRNQPSCGWREKLRIGRV